MTKKEQLRLDNMIAENILLKDELNKQFRIYGDTVAELVSLKARIETIKEVVSWDIGEEYTEDVK